MILDAGYWMLARWFLMVGWGDCYIVILFYCCIVILLAVD